jgi:DNA-binding CsgD family transcriptional regulator
MPAEVSKDIRDDAFKLLHREGWSDTRISRAFGLYQKVVWNWRSAAGLPPNAKQFRRANLDYDHVLELYRSGHNDYEIARELDIDPSLICKWRKSKGLPALPQKRYLSPEMIRQARKMLKLGASNDHVAADLNVSRQTIQKLRRHLPSSGLRKHGITNRSIRNKVLRDQSIMQRIEKAVGGGMPAEVRYEAVLSLYTEVLEGRVLPECIEQRAAHSRGQAWSLCGSKFGPRSLDDELAEDWTLGDTIEDFSALEEMEAAAEAVFSNDD